MSFNSRSREGSDPFLDIRLVSKHSFNSRSREGSDKIVLFVIRISINVSIHAPVKGATKSDEVYLYPAPVSIHAPVKGATNTLC